MNSKIKVALLCNNKMALPALQTMARMRTLCAIATTDRDPEVVETAKSAAGLYNVPYCCIVQKGYKQQLQQWMDVVKPDVVFVMTFPWRITEELLCIPQLGFINFHYGLLPEMQGADPVFESIRQRRSTAGLTVHVMDKSLDTGPIILREEIPLPHYYTYGMLCSQLAQLGEKMCRQLLQELGESKKTNAVQQDEARARYWPKVDKEVIKIKWQEMDAAAVTALVRSCNPIARGVPVTLNGWQFGICDVSEINLQITGSLVVPGTILALDAQNGLIVSCRDGKAVKLEVVITGEGIFPGYKMALWNVQAGMVFS